MRLCVKSIYIISLNNRFFFASVCNMCARWRWFVYILRASRHIHAKQMIVGDGRQTVDEMIINNEMITWHAVVVAAATRTGFGGHKAQWIFSALSRSPHIFFTRIYNMRKKTFIQYHYYTS